ncbi:MAG TPA: hypothetical protein VFC19_32310 [Candidatus Limnocylindrales bacterium]|nr:hypothetical protein [Candidatus Limnocylindrales bacterium]
MELKYRGEDVLVIETSDTDKVTKMWRRLKSARARKRRNRLNSQIYRS